MGGSRRDAGGFTLLEILVVLVIAGLLVGIAMPRLQLLMQSVEFAAQRKSILTQLDALGYRAFSQGRPLRLTSLPQDPAAADEAPLALPPGWRIEASPAIDYSFNGACSGGKVSLVSPDQRAELFELKPPLCRVAAEG